MNSVFLVRPGELGSADLMVLASVVKNGIKAVIATGSDATSH